MKIRISILLFKISCLALIHYLLNKINVNGIDNIKNVSIIKKIDGSIGKSSPFADFPMSRARTSYLNCVRCIKGRGTEKVGASSFRRDTLVACAAKHESPETSSPSTANTRINLNPDLCNQGAQTYFETFQSPRIKRGKCFC
ncbi:hypothetical protein KQX54_008711 [Cotesia glomerata]|uniref:Uncharacterized protein n=1 Tax=Cotesia glomerata TaxID=32391 RepID=A0AAV7I3N5_COTGL|nr:hypothetical protein KQX54_008711 [Cotesia glomerata]